MRKLYLASTSPRRQTLLRGMGLVFETRAKPVDETCDLPPQEAVGALALRKAQAAFDGLSGGLVIAADTLVALAGRTLGKPRDAREACDMLHALSGRSHWVYTGLCVADTQTGRCLCRTEATEVTFRPLTDDEIDAYVHTGEPLDKAGAYAIQGGAGAFVDSYQGDFETVIGLPTAALSEMLREMGE